MTLSLPVPHPWHVHSPERSVQFVGRGGDSLALSREPEELQYPAPGCFRGADYRASKVISQQARLSFPEERVGLTMALSLETPCVPSASTAAERQEVTCPATALCRFGLPFCLCSETRGLHVFCTCQHSGVAHASGLLYRGTVTLCWCALCCARPSPSASRARPAWRPPTRSQGARSTSSRSCGTPSTTGPMRAAVREPEGRTSHQSQVARHGSHQSQWTRVVGPLQQCLPLGWRAASVAELLPSRTPPP